MIVTASTLNEEQLPDLPHALKGEKACHCTGYRAIEDAIRGVRHAEADEPGQSQGRSLPAPQAARRS